MALGYFVKKKGAEAALDCTGGFGDFYVQHALLDALATVGVVISEYDGGEIHPDKLDEVQNTLEKLHVESSSRHPNWPLAEHCITSYYERHKNKVPRLCPRDLLLGDIKKLLTAIEFAIKHNAQIEFLGD